MAYVEAGEGDPIVFLHGNPTSKYLWRSVMPYAFSFGRCIAVDLIGMGESDKLANSGLHRYSLQEHYRYLRELLHQLEVNSNAVFIVHDWGSALGFHWANEHREAVRGICFMEAIVRPLRWEEWPNDAKRIFEGFRSPVGEHLVLERNQFVEAVFRRSLLAEINVEDLGVYRKPYLVSGEDRRPTLSWPREIPIDGEPPSVVEVVENYGKWLAKSTIPKLFINASPGAILVGPQREFCRTWPSTSEVTVKAGHFVPEDAPHEVGQALATWLRTAFS